MYRLARPLLFRLPPERAHALTLRAIRMIGDVPRLRVAVANRMSTPPRPVEAFGLRFANRVGLAAGFDKDGVAWQGLAAFGFGHIELGTVTPRPQAGNPSPRLFRLVPAGAIINQLGFPSRGGDYLAGRLANRTSAPTVIGVSIGKNADTPAERAIGDYLELFSQFAPLADYLAINVSSPNTAGLRQLGHGDPLRELLGALVEQRMHQTEKLGRRVPLLVKISPDLTDPELDQALAAMLDTGIDGVIATNTTLSRPGIVPSVQAGGLSGRPLRERATQLVREVHRRSGGRLPIIGVGGIFSRADLEQKLEAGASLVQLYTGLVYQGPGLVRRLLAATGSAAAG